MAQPPDFSHFEVSDGHLGALRWPGIDGAPTVLAVHSTAGNAWHFDPVAHHLSGAADLVALDLRGRGRSFGHAGPFGLDRHVDDVVSIARHLGRPVTALGHGMGAFVALLAAERFPDLFPHVVAVDGGLPPERFDDVDAATVAATEPMIARLRVTWPDRVSYQTMWEQDPAFADGIGLDLQRTLLADLVEVPGGFRTAVNEAAVLIDVRDLFVDDHVRGVLDRRETPASIVRGTLDVGIGPCRFVSDADVARFDQHRWTTVEGANHSTVMLGRCGAAAVADALRVELAGA